MIWSAETCEKLKFSSMVKWASLSREFCFRKKKFFVKGKHMWKKIALVSIALWIISIAIGGYLFIKGTAKTADDGRLSVKLKRSEMNIILIEMRQLLSGVQTILEALTTNDLKVVERTASSLGMKSSADMNPVLMAKLPLEFKSTGMGVHRRFDEMAFKIQSGKMNKDQVLQEVSDIMLTCVGCHQAYHLDGISE
jgi:hypothetical protein